MQIDKKIIYVLFIAFVILYFFKESFWTKYVINISIIVLGFPYKKTDNYYYKQLPFFVLIMSLGLVGFFKFQLRDVVRDIYYFSIPIISLIIAYILAKKNSIEEFITGFVLLGIIFSFCHVIISIQKSGLNIFNDFLKIRDEVSPGNSLSVISLSILLFHKKYETEIIFKKNILRFAIFINAFALILSGSRTYLIITILFFVFLFFKIINLKKILLISALVCITGLITINFSGFEERKDGEDVTFTNKLIGSILEIASSDDYESERDIIVKYRGYESLMAFQTFNSSTFIEKLFGKGFGALIDLEMDVQLGENSFRLIPILHNGFLYILIKTGILGIFVYFLFYFYLFKHIRRFYSMTSNNLQFLFLDRLVKASILSLMASNFVVSSSFNTEFEFLQIFQFTLFFKMVEHEQIFLKNINL